MNCSKVKYKASFQDDWLSNRDFKFLIKSVDGDLYSAKYSYVANLFLFLGKA